MKWDREKQFERQRYARERKRDKDASLMSRSWRVPVLSRMMLSIIYECLEGKKEETSSMLVVFVISLQ